MGTAAAISALISALVLLALLRWRQFKRTPKPPAGKPPKDAFITYESMASASENNDVEAFVTTSNPLYVEKKNVASRK